jgi:Tfp pilus assembly PilM family ATPase
MVTGGGAQLQGFVEMLHERLMIPVERGRPFEKVGSRKGVAGDGEAFLAVAIGLAIPGGAQ